MPYEPLIPANASAIAGSFAAPVSGVVGVKTLAQLRSELNDALGDRDDVDAPRLDGWINDAYQELAGILDLPELKTTFSFPTVIGEDQYILPTGIWTADEASVRDVALFYGNGIPLDKIVDYSVWKGIPETEASSVKRFFNHEQIIALWPNPTVSQIIIVDATMFPQPLTADTHQPIFGLGFNVAFIDYSLYIAHSRLREHDLAGQCLNNALANLRQKKSKIAQQRSNATPSARVVRTEADLLRRRTRGTCDW